MFHSGKKVALNKKAYEVAYALFRVAANMGERGISETLKGEAVQVLEMVVAGDFEAAEKPLEVLDYLVKLAMDLNAIGFANGETLTKEMGNLKLMIANCVQAQGEAVDISDLFERPHLEDGSAGVVEAKTSEGRASPSRDEPRDGRKWPQVPRNRYSEAGFEVDSKNSSDVPQDVSSRNFFSEEGIAVSRAEEYQAQTRLDNMSSSEAVLEADSEGDFPSVADRIFQPENEQPSNSSTGGFLKSGMRQIAILDKIRQSGNCRLKDIQEILPDSSERTIRYDLESLIERRLVERTGNGGPSVSYRIR